MLTWLGWGDTLSITVVNNLQDNGQVNSGILGALITDSEAGQACTGMESAK